jgi:CRP-like cAMP-binding protein
MSKRGRGAIDVVTHARIQEVAYEILSHAHRQALHPATGRALETVYAVRLEEVYERLASHDAKTDATEKAMAYLTHVAEKAARSYAHVEAVKAKRRSAAWSTCQVRGRTVRRLMPYARNGAFRSMRNAPCSARKQTGQRSSRRSSIDPCGYSDPVGCR